MVKIDGNLYAYVIDPSLFSAPVWFRDWFEVQNDPKAIIATGDGTIFYRYSNGDTETDPDYTKTNTVLTKYRLELKNMALGPSAPPPYAWCPVGIEREVARSVGDNVSRLVKVIEDLETRVARLEGRQSR